ncbi:unnamed protein product [Rodentolepis nana]|uniref:Uncharacterized protein n=1 Tax=Rodentolepis nana TaxID=102285 RepID=A0A0R3TEG1_RODNA|nr:unnamed protein product [Rodentolepis nana]
MKRQFLPKLLILACLLFTAVQTEAGCFPKCKRKPKSSPILVAVPNKTSTEERQAERDEEEEAGGGGGGGGQNEAVVEVIAPPVVQMTEQSVEAPTAGAQNERQESDAIQLLARVLNDITERPRPQRRDYYAYPALMDMSTPSIIEQVFRAYILAEIHRIESKMKPK